MRKTLLLFAVVLPGYVFVANGQIIDRDPCAQTLRLAQSIYEQGRLHELPALLQKCISDGTFTDAEKVTAYKLLTLTYIYLEEPVKADENMLNLLRTDTEFAPNNNVDPAEFVALWKTFRTWPIYRIGGKLAAVASQPTVISADYADDGANTYSTNFGFSGSIAGEIPLTGKYRKFTLAPELSFQLLAFDKENKDADTVRHTPGTERHAWLSLPVMLQYSLYQNENTLTEYYVAAGLSFDYLLSASVRITSYREYHSPVAEDNIKIKDQRNKINSGVLVAAGYKRKFGKGFLVAELRYKIGLQPMLGKEDTYANSVLVFDDKSVDGIFKVNTLSLSVGYVLNRYNPKKLRLKP
jgi:hypothetical protein